MVDFLDGALTPIRLEEFTELSQNPLASTILKVFRSLLLLDQRQTEKKWFSDFERKSAKPDQMITKPDQMITKPDQMITTPDQSTLDLDPSYRLSFLYILYWLLTPLRELNILFKFAETILVRVRSDYFTEEQLKEIVESSMFPGNLDPSGGGPQIPGISIQSDYDNDRRNMMVKQNRVTRSGLLAVTLQDDGIRWFI
jgi:hypothetical protein